MDPDDFSRDDLLEPGWLTILMGPLAIALALAWLYTLKRRSLLDDEAPRLGLGVAGAAIAVLGFWCFFQFLSQFFVVATSWPLWVLALLGGAATELIVLIYRLETDLVTPARGRTMLGLRLASLFVLILILLQPVYSSFVDREINREVAILIDDSESMRISDQRQGVSEQLDRAEIFGVADLDDRPAFGQLESQARRLRSRLGEQMATLDAAPDDAPLGGATAEQLATTLAEVSSQAETMGREMDQVLKELKSPPGDVANPLSEMRDLVGKQVTDQLGKAIAGADSGRPADLRSPIQSASEKLDQFLGRWEPIQARVDEHWFAKLPEDLRKRVHEAAARPRSELAVELLRSPVPTDSAEDGEENEQTQPLAERLGSAYNLRFYRFARDPREALPEDVLGDRLAQAAVPGGAASTPEDPADASLSESQEDTTQIEEDANSPEDPPSGFRALTNLTSTLEHVLENTAPESLAGVLLLSDGRHNGAELPEDALRQLGAQNSPLCAVPIGGRQGPVDASILSLRAPESIYLGDRIGLRAEVKLDGLRGEKIKARLRHAGEIVDEQELSVPDVDYRTEVRFAHLPESKGIYDYELELEPLEKERFQDNNRWQFKVAVTDDRTNVLLIDGYPRWDFRYLRNLFYGRDKSVHLQYVLLNPDSIKGKQPLSGVAASARRDFGDAEASELPSEEDEWRQFDVIILGDVPPAALDERTWEQIEESVTDRGALFVCIGGPRFMPHAYESETLRDLLPITWETDREERFLGPEESYRIELTDEGRGHEVTRQSSSLSLNAEIWSSLPDLSWRSVPDSVKDGAEVLAFARPGADERLPVVGANDLLTRSPDSVEAAIERLANRKAYEQEHALITVQNSGRGRVMMMNFDQTWRFRYGVGDTYHHRFWGQVVRWGTGENLRAGTELMRLGTDRLTYTPDDPVQVVVKALDEERRPVTNATLHATILRDGQRVQRQKLSYRSGSNGIYETTVAALTEPGDYRVVLEGSEARLAAERDVEVDEIATEFLVVNTRSPVELAELTADRDFLNYAAQVSGGAVAELTDVASLLHRFGAPREVLTERRDVTLWDNWPLLLTFFGLLTTEWVLRRRSGLA